MVFEFKGPFEGSKVKHAEHHPGQPYDAARNEVSVPERLAMSEGQLARFLYVRLRHADDAVRRARWFGGRIYNNMVGADAAYTDMPGHHLLMAMDWAGVPAPKGVQPDRSYQLRLDVAAKAFEALHLWCRKNGVNYRDWDLELSGPIN